MNKKMIGSIIAIAGVIGAIFSGINIYNDMQPKGLFGVRYTYQFPLTSHETLMIAAAVISGIAILAGIVIYTYKNQNK